jgi:hypothetical protein
MNYIWYQEVILWFLKNMIKKIFILLFSFGLIYPIDDVVHLYTYEYVSSGNAEHDKIALKILNEMRTTSPTKEIMANEYINEAAAEYIWEYFSITVKKYGLFDSVIPYPTPADHPSFLKLHLSVKSFEDTLNELYSKYKNNSQTI